MFCQIKLGKGIFIFLGLPRPAGGSGCVAARRSARPCGGCAAWVWPDGHCYPSLSRGAARLCGGCAACLPLKKNGPL
ncbi:hypothetical protein SGRA_0115 [Saprospira grandis str. Lewin]|uniref:Uncharacterized protein n=1 Tax=Saprospira grandis (strain Lewin) TaxID=984262 RepID=H6L4I1_SAPGL|nr:hypothetical protein SGRA_0115 [Saprospira grandis str. Lewin]